MPAFYAVHKGRVPGVYTSWSDCEKNVKGFPNANFKKFFKISDANSYAQNGVVRTESLISNFFEVKNDTCEDDVDEDNDENSEISSKLEVDVYTDGSFFKKNGKTCSGYGIYIPSKDIRKSIILQKPKTNNRAEMMAIIDSIKLFESNNTVRLNIYTDSKYCMLIFGGTGARYAKNNFRRSNGGRGNAAEVPNKDLIIEALKLVSKYDLNFVHVYSHTSRTDRHSNGNRIVDQLAVNAALEDYIGQFENKKDGVNYYKLMHGKYKGEILNKVPVSYLNWIAKSDKFEEFCIEKNEYRLEKEIVLKYLDV